ncbi:unnamed protein product [Parnassius mnemosyne]|uniref:Cyclin-like domain-containing protein n=1 Tax=Parnassius mnemosyne TaxID=213953 RepID=A0AAV1LHS0_9NEOP
MANKENIDTLKVKTKIPLPLVPLPALPKHLLLKKIQEVPTSKDKRIPLTTISSLSSLPAGSSTGNGKVVPTNTICTNEVDSKYVTFRKRKENLEYWDYKVCKDEADNKDSSIISIIDVEESFIKGDKKEYNKEISIIPIIDDKESFIAGDKKEYKDFSENEQKSCLGVSRREDTLVPCRVRSIKMRLLKFNDQLDHRLQTQDIFEESDTKCSESEYVKDLFLHFLNNERPAPVPRIPSSTRACVLNWLLVVNGSEGNPAVIQTASWYLDSVLSITSVRLDELQPLAAASYWIARKHHGPVVPSSVLIKYSNGAFNRTQLLEAEKTILNKLKFPSQPVVPQDYITYLSWWSDNDHPDEIELAATFICLCGLMVDKTLCSELPSVIAAACVRNALLLLGKRDLMLRLETCPVFQAAEKKTTRMCCICSILRRAVRTVSDIKYEFKAPMEIFGIGPHSIAQEVVKYANELAISEGIATSSQSSKNTPWTMTSMKK